MEKLPDLNAVKGGFGERLAAYYSKTVFSDAYVLHDVLIDGKDEHKSQVDLIRIAASGMDVVFPCHPRTRERLRALMNDGMSATGSLNDVDSLHFHLIEPVGFYDIIRLEKEARVVMTDSGGVQKEAFFYGTPSVILRPETEWVEIVDAGAGILADADYERIMAAYEALNGREVKFPPLFGDGHASERILRKIVNEV